MKAIEVAAPGDHEVLKLVDQSSVSPGHEEVAVTVTAAGVNFIDVYQRSGQYRQATPFTPGLEGAGTVTAVGDDVSDFDIGDRVAWAQVPGSYAQQLIAPADKLVPIPPQVSDEYAAAVMLQGMTAHYLSHATYPVQTDDVVVVHAAAGGVGLLLTQLAVLRGARVIATVSTSAKAELASAAGAEIVCGYEDFHGRVLDATDGLGAHAVYDGVGKATFESSLASLRVRGTLALYGQSSGAVPAVDPQVLSQQGSVYLTRPTLAHYIADRSQFLERITDIFSLIASGELEVRIAHCYALADAGRAHQELEARRTTGKLILLPQP